MAAQLISMSRVKQIIRLNKHGSSIKEISRLLKMSKNTVKKYLRWSEDRQEQTEDLLKMEDESLEQLFTSDQQERESEKHKTLTTELPYICRELKRKHVTRKLLWIEYRKRHPSGYGYAQFCVHIRSYERSRDSTMVVHHAIADKLYVDFAGSRWTVYEDIWGPPQEKQLFVACLGYSQYAYVEVVNSQCTEDFVLALRRCLEYFGKVPKAIVPDNLKAAVTKTDRYEPKLNKVLEDFANHYGTTIVPARSGKPQDKALVENMVKHVYNQIKGPLRDRKFYSLEELNDSILEQLDIYNTQDFQRRSGSRASAYEEEKELMGELPEQKFEIKKYKRLQVQKNSHILLGEDNHYYSIPYAYIGKRVQVVYTHSLVKVFFNYQSIACHARNRKEYYYTTVREHLPSHYNDYQQRSPEYYNKWASSQPGSVQEVIDKILTTRQHPEQAYRSCEGIKHLWRNTDKESFEKACMIACEYKCYQYSFIKALIENGMTHQEVQENVIPHTIKQNHQNIRGKQHYQNQ